MAFLIPSIQFLFGLPRALFCFGIHFNAVLGNLPSAIHWTWPYHVSWFCSKKNLDKGKTDTGNYLLSETKSNTWCWSSGVQQFLGLWPWLLFGLKITRNKMTAWLRCIYVVRKNAETSKYLQHKIKNNVAITHKWLSFRGNETDGNNSN